MTDLHRLSTTDLAATIASGEVSSREAVDHFATRIAELDGPINAVVLTDIDRARAEAGAIDEARGNGRDLGPPAGAPMTVKDSFSTRGMVTTSGSPTPADHVPAGEGGQHVPCAAPGPPRPAARRGNGSRSTPPRPATTSWPRPSGPLPCATGTGSVTTSGGCRCSSDHISTITPRWPSPGC